MMSWRILRVADERSEAIDKTRARAAFDAAAAAYDEAAVLQREVADRSLERLELMRIAPRRVLDLGAGTGYCSRALGARYPKSRVILLDMAPAMLRHARAAASTWERLRGRYAYVVGDAERLPLADASVDLAFSNLTLQWCTELERSFSELRRVLRPGGLLLFTTFGPDTLKELRSAWAAADGYTHTSAFIDMHDIGDALVRSRFADPVMDMEYLEVTYPDVYGLMRDLKQIGAHNATSGRPRGLTGRQRLRRMVEAYEAFRRERVLPATYEVIYGHAWAPEAPLQERHAGVTAIPFERVRAGLKRGGD